MSFLIHIYITYKFTLLLVPPIFDYLWYFMLTFFRVTYRNIIYCFVKGRMITWHLFTITLYQQEKFLLFFLYITVIVWILSKRFVLRKYLPIQTEYYFSMLPMYFYFSSYACSHFQSGNLLVKFLRANWKIIGTTLPLDCLIFA